MAVVDDGLETPFRTARPHVRVWVLVQLVALFWILSTISGQVAFLSCSQWIFKRRFLSNIIIIHGFPRFSPSRSLMGPFQLTAKLIREDCVWPFLYPKMFPPGILACSIETTQESWTWGYQWHDLTTMAEFHELSFPSTCPTKCNGIHWKDFHVVKVRQMFVEQFGWTPPNVLLENFCLLA